MNPYLAGFLLGLVLLAAIFITGRGLGASGAMKSVVVAAVGAAAPAHAAARALLRSEYAAEHARQPAQGVARVRGRRRPHRRLPLRPRLRPARPGRPRGARASASGTRLAFALAGGALFGIGAQFARGCTSGAALSGMAVLSTAGFVTMLAIFGTGYAVAFFFRRLWI